MASTKSVIKEQQTTGIQKANPIYELYRRYMKHYGLKFEDVGNRLNCCASNVYRIMDKPVDDLTIRQIFTIGKAVNCPRSEILKAISNIEE